MIRINELTKKYGSRTAVDKLSATVAQGEVFGLLGTNGAGKTTTIRILTTMSRAVGGTATVGGHDVVRERHEVRKLIGTVPQERNLDHELTVIDNLEIQARLYSLSHRRQRIDECLELFGLGNERKSQVDKLSGGMQRRLLIARALLSRPQVLVLDEPTIGLDPQVRRDIWDTVTRIRNDGVTVLLTTHYMDEAGYLCDRIGLMKSGRLVMTDTPANLQGLAGSYMVEIQRDSGIDRILCRDRSEAERTADGHPDALVRQANLEDAFIALTGQESHA